jgi:cyclin C
VQDVGQEDMLLPLAWSIVNKTEGPDLSLLSPPFTIALACLQAAHVVEHKDGQAMVLLSFLNK